jgi:hypothetical protein
MKLPCYLKYVSMPRFNVYRESTWSLSSTLIYISVKRCDAMRCDAIDENKSTEYYALHLHLHLHLHDVDQFDPRNTVLT